MRDVDLYRRPPFLVGDEAAVLRYTRGFRRKRRLAQLAFLASVAGIAAAITFLNITSFLTVMASFAVASSLFVVLHLALGKRLWMQPVQAYEDGVAASHITALFCRRRFAAWEDVEGVALEPLEGADVCLVVRLAGGRTLVSAPGEFDSKGLAAIHERLSRTQAEAAKRRAIFDAVGAGGSPDA